MTPDLFSLTWEEVVAVIAAFSFMWYELKAIRRDIRRLEDKVEKHNNFDRRIVRIETKLNIESTNGK